MNNNNEGIAFFMGILAGIVLCSLILGGCSLTKPDGVIQTQKEAVSYGHGKWVVDTNWPDKPHTKFEWNK